ncbi:TonB-dependent receptor [Pedobacter sp. GR22-6]|uniref:TonB-dependent receptor n=1 Tax=Pedobacter sp. GR22-6 TaxID=3127957 RepID=UPI00307EA027
MKITTILLLSLIMQVSASTYGQKLNLQKQNSSLKEIFREIKKQTGYNVVWKSRQLEKTHTVDVNFQDVELEQALETLLYPQQLGYIIKDETIVINTISPRPGPRPITVVQNITVAGRVLDEKGLPLAGASVKIKGSNVTVATDTEGRFRLENVVENAVLQISFVGYLSLEEAVAGRRNLELRLQPDLQQLEQLVVVGYGSQKKLNLTGAIDQVGAEVFENRPLPNVTRGLQGVIPNLNIRMTDGKPTRGATYNVRGTTSLSGGSALVLIDGVAGDPGLLNPNDIENITVLKDAASAAVYGARGAYGVVLITTKSAKNEKLQIRFNSSYALNQQTVEPKMVWDGYTWTKMFNESFQAYNDYTSTPTGINNAFPFSLSYLDSLRYRAENPGLGLPDIGINPSNGRYVYYGNTDWLKELYKNVTPGFEQNISISNGNEKMSYFISGRYYKQNGIYRYNPDDFNKYNFRAKGDIKLNSWLKLFNNLDYSAFDYREPLNSIYQNHILRNIADQGFPVAMMNNPDGTLTQHAAFTLGDFKTGNSNRSENENMLRNTTSLKANLLDNKININADFTFMQRNRQVQNQVYPVSYSNSPGVIETAGNNYLRQDLRTEQYYANNIFGDYKMEWGKHYFKGMLGYNLEYSRARNNRFQRDGLLNPELPDFSLMDGLNYTATGGGNDWGIMGAFYRLNYIYDSKYLFEFNGRYDGSSRFPKDQRFGFFPSASAGWRISEESFLSGSKNWLDNLKVRASYGSLPNGDIDDYLFITTLAATRSGMLLDGVFPSQINKPEVLPNKLTWETSTTLDFGLDLNLFRNRISFVFDWYSRKTTDMFTALQPLPRTFGATVPKGNNADLETKGWELTLGWADKIEMAKPLAYNIRLVLADQDAYITKFNNPTLNLGSTYYPGMRLGEIWGYTTEGLFQNVEDVRNHADQKYIRTSSGNNYLPGDIKFADLNGDGVINDGKNTLTDPGDRSIIGNSQLRYTYGVNLGLNWNNFSLDAFVQGVGKRDWWPGTEAGYFWGQYNRPYGFLPEHILGNYWTPENPDAYFPRYRGYLAQNGTGTLRVTQTRYLQDASYVRLKNLTIGYNLPKPWLEKTGISSAKIYVNGQNLWTYSPMYKITKNFDPEVIEGADPEINSGNGNGYRYPMLRTFTFGLDISL